MIHSLLLPRPLMLLSNGLQFGGGVLFALLEGAAREPGRARAFSAAPFMLFVLAWFMVQEFLVQQAKYMWNDLRDHEVDQDHPANKQRPISRQTHTRGLTIALLGRWGAGLLLAALLSPTLLLIVLLTSLLQVFYEYAAKPMAARHPLWPLFTVGSSAVLKFMGGALAAGWSAGDQRLWLYGLAMFGTGIVYISSYWRVEADYFREQGTAVSRRQSAYFAQAGMDWSKAGAVVGLGACTLLFLDAFGGYLEPTGVNAAGAILLICSAGLLLSLLSFSLLRERTGLRRLLVPAAFVGVFWFVRGGLGSLWPPPRTAVSAGLILILLLIDYRANYGMDYKQQNLLYVRENWPGRRKMVGGKRPFALLKSLWRLNTPNFEP